MALSIPKAQQEILMMLYLKTHIDCSALVLRNHTFILFGNIRGLWASVPTWSKSSSESGRTERSKSTPISLIRAVALLLHL